MINIPKSVNNDVIWRNCLSFKDFSLAFCQLVRQNEKYSTNCVEKSKFFDPKWVPVLRRSGLFRVILQGLGEPF